MQRSLAWLFTKRTLSVICGSFILQIHETVICRPFDESTGPYLSGPCRAGLGSVSHIGLQAAVARFVAVRKCDDKACVDYSRGDGRCAREKLIAEEELTHTRVRNKGKKRLCRCRRQSETEDHDVRSLRHSPEPWPQYGSGSTALRNARRQVADVDEEERYSTREGGIRRRPAPWLVLGHGELQRQKNDDRHRAQTRRTSRGGGGARRYSSMCWSTCCGWVLQIIHLEPMRCTGREQGDGKHQKLSPKDPSVATALAAFDEYPAAEAAKHDVDAGREQWQWLMSLVICIYWAPKAIDLMHLLIDSRCSFVRCRRFFCRSSANFQLITYAMQCLHACRQALHCDPFSCFAERVEACIYIIIVGLTNERNGFWAAFVKRFCWPLSQ